LEHLRTHQLVCFLLGVTYPEFAFWVDMGGGKTLVALELLNYWMEVGQIKRAVIVLKSDKAILTWEKQIRLWGITRPWVTLEGSSEDKWRALGEHDGGFVLVARPGLRAMLSRPVGANGKVKYRMDPQLVHKFMNGIGGMVLDESTDDANYRSLNHQLAVQMRRGAGICYALAGRPMGRDPTLLWAQFYILDEGATLGSTLGLFRQTFFTSVPNRFAKGRMAKYARDYHFKKRMMPDLNRMIQNRSIAYSSDECGGLPKSVAMVEEVSFPEQASVYYQRAVEAVIAAKGNLREMKNLFVRMRQMSSGFVGFQDDDTGEKVQVQFDENPKLDLLLELIEQVPEDAKAVVFYEFTYSGRQIAKELTDMGLDHIWLWSGTKDSKGDLQRFEKDPDVRVAVINHRVGAYSLDGLQVANYTFFYETPVSSIDREQAERRVIRDGQKHTVFQYDLIVSESMDAKVLAYHKEGANLVAALLRDPRKVLDGPKT